MKGPTDRRKVTFALFIATFLAAIEGTIVSTAMPKITGELHGLEQYSWVISVYLLATVIGTPIYGKLADLYGRKSVFMTGALIFLAGSMLSGLSQTMEQLILFRVVQGLGAGALITVPYTIIADIYPFEQRGKVLGWTASIWGIAGIAGPPVGGLLVDYVSWRAIFYMNLPFGMIALTLFHLSFRESFERRKRHIDYPGIVTFAGGMFCFLYALTLLGGETGTPVSRTGTLLWLAGAAVLLTAFFIAERRSPEPIVPLGLFRIRTISTANADSFLICVINVAAIFYVPLWIQGVYGESATYSGLAMIPLSVGWPLGSIVAGNLMAKIGMRRLSITGALFLIAGSAGFATMTASTPVWMLMIFTFLAGMSFGLSLTSFTVAIQSAVGWEVRGSATAMNNFIRNLGQTIGIAVFGMMLHTGSANTLEPAKLEASLHGIFLVILALSFVALLLSLNLPKQEERAEPAAS